MTRVIVFDPYPLAQGPTSLFPRVAVTPSLARLGVAKLNLDDPQPPGYRYRLPLSAEYDHWAKARDLVVPEEAYLPWDDGVDISPPIVAVQPGIGHYNQGLWLHVGGAVHSYIGDPQGQGVPLAHRGGSWDSDACRVRAAAHDYCDGGYALACTGCRVVRGSHP